MSRARSRKAVSPVVGALVLIGVAVAAALLLGFMVNMGIKASKPKGAALAIAGVELYDLGKYGSYYYAMISVKVANSGSDAATISQIVIAGPDYRGYWKDNLKTINVNKQVLPGETFTGAWTFNTGSYYHIKAGKVYVVKIIYGDPYGGGKVVSVNVKCERGSS